MPAKKKTVTKKKPAAKRKASVKKSGTAKKSGDKKMTKKEQLEQLEQTFENIDPLLQRKTLLEVAEALRKNEVTTRALHSALKKGSRKKGTGKKGTGKKKGVVPPALRGWLNFSRQRAREGEDDKKALSQEWKSMTASQKAKYDE